MLIIFYHEIQLAVTMGSVESEAFVCLKNKYIPFRSGKTVVFQIILKFLNYQFSHPRRNSEQQKFKI